MSENPNDFSNLGEQIKSIVSDAIHTMDYDQLNKNIGSTVNRALDEARRGIQRGAQEAQRAQERSRDTQRQRQRGSYSSFSHATANPAGQEQFLYRKAMQPAKKKELRTQTAFPVSSSPAGRVAGPLYMSFGGLGVGVFAILFIIFGALAMTGFGGFGTAAVFMLIFGLLCSGMLYGGIQIQKRTKRFKKYTVLMKDKTYSSIKELADRTHKSSRFVARDLRTMIDKGMFPDGQVDEDGTYFFGDYKTYQQFLTAKQGLKSREEAKVREKAEEEAADADASHDEASRAVRDAIKKGRAYMKEVRSINDDLPGEEISKKLDRLETVIGKIFTRVEEKPEQLQEIRKFMEYYLPTTEKLLQAYKDFEQQPIQGANIVKSKQEIENTLDTINTAFENLLNSLYQDDVMDVSSDISVLHAMFAQEGLTKDDINNHAKEEYSHE